MKECPECGAEYAEYFRFCGVDGSPLTNAAESDPLIGVTIDKRYRLTSLLGRGAFGAVYRSKHERVPRDFAVKILSAHLSNEPSFVARFEKEVRAEAVLSHANIVEVIDYGFAENIGYYIVMEYLNGEALNERLTREGQLKILETYTILHQVGSALNAAHNLGIIHRDFKAENVFLVDDPGTDEGFSVRLLDFGVAKVMRPEGDLAVHDEDLTETRAGTVVGTPYTMSPEQILGRPVDPRADIYSLGVLMYEMFTGAVPFIGETLNELLDLHLKTPPQAPSRVPGAEWIPPELDELILQMLAKSPEERPENIEEVIDRLDEARPATQDGWATFHLISGRGDSDSPAEHDGDRGVHGGDTERMEPAVANTDVGPGPAVAPGRAELAGNSATTTDRRGDRPKVLIVDDEAAIRRLVRRIVSTRGYDGVLASTGQKALEWLQANPRPHAVILDLLMPGVDGLTVLRQIRRSGYDGPVIVCSGIASAAVRDEARRLGAMEFLDKLDEFHRIPELLDRAQQ